jgi:hypothetical protein
MRMVFLRLAQALNDWKHRVTHFFSTLYISCADIFSYFILNFIEWPRLEETINQCSLWANYIPPGKN